ncbi:MAG: site-2 protease family protein [Acidobacteriota bacterium]
MIKKVYRLPFRILGIPVDLDLTFLLILPVLAWLIGSQLGRFIAVFNLPVDAELLTRGVRPYLLGLIAAVGLFASVLIHELGHSVIGRMFHFRIRNITLWILGGMAQFDRIPRRKGFEAIMAAAGPATSILVGGVALLLLRITPSDWPGTRFVLTYLMYMNFLLAAFNLLPALPLDGGRVFRSLLALKLPFLEATQVATSISKFLAIVLGLVGFLSLNIWLILIAFFIYIAVSGEAQQATVTEALRGISVRDVMTHEVHTVAEDMTVSDLVHRMLTEHYLSFPVLDAEGRLTGFVTLQDVRKHRSTDGDEGRMRVAEIMSRRIDRIREHQSALDAFQRIANADSGRLVVTNADGRLSGIISKTDLLRVVQVRMVEAELSETQAS